MIVMPSDINNFFVTMPILEGCNKNNEKEKNLLGKMLSKGSMSEPIKELKIIII